MMQENGVCGVKVGPEVSGAGAQGRVNQSSGRTLHRAMRRKGAESFKEGRAVKGVDVACFLRLKKSDGIELPFLEFRT